MPKRPLMLVPFAPATARDALRERLLELGYAVEVTNVHGAPQRESCHVQPIAVCLFGRDSLTENRESTLAALMHWAGLPRLGLFMGHQSDWDAADLNDFNDPITANTIQTSIEFNMVSIHHILMWRYSYRLNDYSIFLSTTMIVY